MALEIHTQEIKPRRVAFAHLARRFGEDHTATRYQEATYDLQAVENFHYRPLWEPQFEVFDKGRTAMVMQDWHDLKDPRQYYYGTYTIARAKMMEAADRSIAFAEKRGLFATIDPSWRSLVEFYLIPLRHYEWGANMNACNISDRCYSSAMSQAAMFATMDRLGIAQFISRIGLAMGGTDTLEQAKLDWVDAPEWQKLRQLVEDSFVVEDWFEVLLLQFLCMDGAMYELVYEAFDAAGNQNGASSISMVTEFMSDWHAESARWTDAVIARAVAESDANRQLLEHWFERWSVRVAEAIRPLAAKVMCEVSGQVVDAIVANLAARAARLGLHPVESAT